MCVPGGNVAVHCACDAVIDTALQPAIGDPSISNATAPPGSLPPGFGLLPETVVHIAGSVLILFSAFCFCAAVWRELVPQVSDPAPQARRLPRPILFLINGSLTLVALLALISLWTTRYRGL